MSVLFTRRGPVPNLGVRASDLAVGSSVFFKVDGLKTEFLVVHQGNPDATLYDTSCDGTWLLMKDACSESLRWAESTSNGQYKISPIHTYFNNTFFPMIDSKVQTIVKEVKIPYQDGVGINGSISSGSKGLSTRVFALAAREVGIEGTSDVVIMDGICLDYFKEDVKARRKCTVSGSPVIHYLRTASPSTSYDAWYVYTDGSYSRGNATVMHYARPALILPSKTRFDTETHEIML